MSSIDDIELLDKDWPPELSKLTVDIIEKLAIHVVNHDSLIIPLCNAMTRFWKWDRYADGFDSFMRISRRMVSENSQVFQRFETLMRNLYQSVSQDDEAIKTVRGLMCEEVLWLLVSRRFNDGNKSGRGCIVTVRGQKIAVDGRQTIDVAGWNGIKGEFYEAKSGARRIADTNVLDYLVALKRTLDSCEIANRVACVCMRERNDMEDQLRNKGLLQTLIQSKIRLFGRGELNDLRWA